MSKEMTTYQIISTVISIIALLISIGVPLCQYLWKTYWVKATIRFQHDGQVALFFNKSGAYIRINGFIESKRKSTIIKKVKLELTHDKTGKKLHLPWFSFISPVTQTLVSNNFQQTSTLSKEIAHPFRLEANSIVCSFIEFGDPSQTTLIKIEKACSNFEQQISKQQLQNSSFQDILDFFSSKQIYIDAKNEILEEYYWNLGTYSMDITIVYDNNESAKFSYTFEIKEHEFDQLRNNVNEMLTIGLKEFYKIPWSLKSPTVTLTNKKNSE